MNTLSVSTPSDAFERFSKLLSGVPNALNNIGPMTDGSDALLRGLYGLCVSGLEVYFTYVIPGALADRSRSAASPEEWEKLTDQYKLLAQLLRIRRPANLAELRQSAKDPAAELRKCTFADLASVTINRSCHISCCIDFLRNLRHIEANYWGKCARILDAPHGDYVLESLDLIVQRRNRIFHYGDFDFSGEQTEINVQQVRIVYSMVTAIVRAVEY